MRNENGCCRFCVAAQPAQNALLSISIDTGERVIEDYVALTPLGRLETPEDVADVVVFLFSDSARFMTGQGVNVTGGVRMD